MTAELQFVRLLKVKRQTQTELLRRHGKREFPEYGFFLSNLPKKLHEIENTYDLKGALDPLIVCTFKVSVLTLQLYQNSGGSRTIFLSMVSSATIGIDQNLSVRSMFSKKKTPKYLKAHEQFKLC